MAGTVRPRLKSDFPWNLNKLYFILSLDIEDSNFSCLRTENNSSCDKIERNVADDDRHR